MLICTMTLEYIWVVQGRSQGDAEPSLPHLLTKRSRKISIFFTRNYFYPNTAYKGPEFKTSHPLSKKVQFFVPPPPFQKAGLKKFV